MAGQGTVSLKELAREPYILLDLPHSRDYFFGLFRSVGAEPRVTLRSRSQELIRGLVANGQGFSIQNAISPTNLAYDGKRVAVLALTEPLQPTRILCLRLKHYPVRPAVAAFESFVCEAFAAGGRFAPGLNNHAADRCGGAARRLSARGGCFRRRRARHPPAR